MGDAASKSEGPFLAVFLPQQEIGAGRSVGQGNKGAKKRFVAIESNHEKRPVRPRG